MPTLDVVVCFLLEYEILPSQCHFSLQPGGRGGKVADVQTFIFLCSVESVSHTDHVTFFGGVLFFLWGCSPATVAELRGDWKNVKRDTKKGTPVFVTSVSMTLESLHWSVDESSCDRRAKVTSPGEHWSSSVGLLLGAQTQTTSKLDPSDCIGPLEPLLVLDCRRLKGPASVPLPRARVLVFQLSLQNNPTI